MDIITFVHDDKPQDCTYSIHDMPVLEERKVQSYQDFFCKVGGIDKRKLPKFPGLRYQWYQTERLYRAEDQTVKRDTTILFIGFVED